MAETPAQRAARSARSDWVEVFINCPQFSSIDEVGELPIGDLNQLLAGIRLRELRFQRAILQAVASGQSKKGYTDLSDKIKKSIGEQEEYL